MTILPDPTELTVTEAAQRGVARLVADAEQGTDLVVTRRHEPEPPREPVPRWLADRLIHTAGMSREAVAALDLEEAVDAWADFRSRPR